MREIYFSEDMRFIYNVNGILYELKESVYDTTKLTLHYEVAEIQAPTATTVKVNKINIKE